MTRVGGIGALLVCLGLLGTRPAASAEVTAEVDRTTLRAGEQITLTVTARGAARAVPEVQTTALEADFQVYSAGQSQSINMVNGKVDVRTTRTLILVPRREGTFTLGPIEVRVGGEVHRTQPIQVTVSGAPPPPAPPPGDPGELGSTRGTEDLFVRATVDKATAYVSEQVTVRVRLYQRSELLDSPRYSPPEVEGFWKEDLPPPNIVVETVEGKRYRVLETRMALFPTRPGTLTIGESVIECTVVDPARARDPFSFFGNSFRDGKRVILRTEPLSIRVKPLPPDAPPGFQGAVGAYRLEVTADRRELNQTEPLTLTLRVTGEGHLRAVGEMELPPLPAFRSYPSTASQEQSAEGDRIRGSVSQQFVLVPLRAGELTVPPIPFTYFSPAEGSYRTLRSEPLQVRATAGAPEVGGAGRGAIEVIGRDIRFLETEVPRFGPRRGAWHAAQVWLRLLPMPFLAAGGLWLWEVRRRRWGSNRAGYRRARALARARKRLASARGSGPGEQVRAAGAAVRGYVADRFDLPEAGLTAETMREALASQGADPAACLDFIARTDAARYAPAAPGADRWLDDAARLLSGLEAAT